MLSAKWDKRFMDLARLLASWSKEQGKHVGAVIVDHDKIVRSTGFNGFPRGVNDDDASRHARLGNAKHIWSVHAEVNAIIQAGRTGTDIQGCTLYVSIFPCSTCAKAIIQAGLKELVAPPPDLTDPHWGPDFVIARAMLTEAGLLVREPVLTEKAPLYPQKTSISTASRRQIDPSFAIEDLFADKHAGFDVVMGTLAGQHGTFINPQSEKAYFIVEGQGDVFLDDQTIPVEAMDFVYIPRGCRHGIAGALKFLIFCCPPFNPADEKTMDLPQ